MTSGTVSARDVINDVINGAIRYCRKKKPMQPSYLLGKRELKIHACSQGADAFSAPSYQLIVEKNFFVGKKKKQSKL